MDVMIPLPPSHGLGLARIASPPLGRSDGYGGSCLLRSLPGEKSLVLRRRGELSLCSSSSGCCCVSM